MENNLHLAATDGAYTCYLLGAYSTLLAMVIVCMRRMSCHSLIRDLANGREAYCTRHCSTLWLQSSRNMVFLQHLSSCLQENGDLSC